MKCELNIEGKCQILVVIMTFDLKKYALHLRSLCMGKFQCRSSGFGKSQLRNFQRTHPKNGKIGKKNLSGTRQTSKAELERQQTGETAE